MIRRKYTDKLAAWKNARPEQKMCLMIKGARQVGKTFVIEQFGSANYQCFYSINFVTNPEYKEIFDGSIDCDSVLSKMSLFIPNFRIEAQNTLIFLDEIQECPRARAALKFLSKNPSFHVIASGSMLGINYKDVPSYPVGYVETWEMHGLDFEEFLWALGVSESVIAEVKHCFDTLQPVNPLVHKKMLEFFKLYMTVGGMPNVVQQYIDTKNFGTVLSLQRGIVNDYLEDIAKYAEKTEKAKARACFLSIPKHLSKDYKKFRYSLVESKGTSSKFAGSLMWLNDAGIINFCHNLGAIELPLEGNAKSDCFKVYMSDTGLLVSMLEDGSQLDLMRGNLGIYKGALFENIVADTFSKNGKKLYYFEHNSQIEVDFITRIAGKTCAVEVKSADNTKSKSLTAALNHYGAQTGVLLSSKNVAVSESGLVRTIPLYMAMWL